MEKKATYTVISPPPQPPHHTTTGRQWMTIMSMGVSVVAVVVACVTAAVVNEQSTRVNHLEERVIEMEASIEDILRLTLANNNEYDSFYDGGDGDGDGGVIGGGGGDYLYYDDVGGDGDGVDGDKMQGKAEEITVRRVLRRRRREVEEAENEVPNTSSVPIFDQSYGVDLKTNQALKGLRLYDSLLDNEEGEEEAEVTTPDTTESPIKPHHRVSNLWVPKKRKSSLPPSSGPPTPLSARTLVRQIDSANGLEEDEENEFAENLLGSVSPGALRRSRLMERRSRTKSLHRSSNGLKRRQKHRARSNPSATSVVFRHSFVKATSRHDGYTGPNSVVPQGNSLPEVPKVVPQDVGMRGPEALSRPPTSRFYGKGETRVTKRMKPRHRTGRRGRSSITLAHFGASVSSNATRQVLPGTGDHTDWSPAPWMDKLGLTKQYTMERGTVTVRQGGLYYIYAQVLHESGRAGGGFQVLVDEVPVIECQAPALRPAPSCFTGGVTYLHRNAQVRIRDLDNYLRTVQEARNTFFGLVKLMDVKAPAQRDGRTLRGRETN